jgi:hypothetical protein
VHLVIDPERGPAHRPVGLPLQLDVPAGDGDLDALAVRLGVDDGALGDVPLQRRHLEHLARSSGLTGRNGEYVSRRSGPSVGSMIAMIASNRSSARRSIASNRPER